MKTLLLLLAVSAHADSWDRVAKLRRGVQVRVETTAGSRLEGALCGVQGDRVILRLRGQDVAWERTALTRVAVRKNTLGSGLGMAGAVILAKPALVPVIAASVNAFLPVYETVYRERTKR